MKRIISLILCLTATFAAAPIANAQGNLDSKYQKGAVPEENGTVVFRQTFECPGKSRNEIYSALEMYTKMRIEGKESNLQSRITQASPEEGIVAASMVETLTFKSTNWQLDTAQIFFQLVFTAHDGGYEAMLRRIHYIYEPMEVYDVKTNITAEDWITDSEAFNRNGKLTKVGGKKFRVFTIDRKDLIFDEAFKAVMK